MKTIAILLLLITFSAHAQEEKKDSDLADLKKQVAQLAQELAEVRAEQSLRLFYFNGQITSSFDDIEVREHYPTARDNSGLNYLRLRFSLDTFFNLDPKIKIYARMTTTKHFNRWSFQGTETRPTDLDAAYKYSGPTVFLEKAYVDYLFTDNFTLSIGKLPTVEGSPSHLWDDQTRQSSYPIMNFNIPLDAIAFTYKYDNQLPRNHLMSFRFLYTPLSVVNLGSGLDAYLDFPKQDLNGTKPTGDDVKTISDMTTVQVDYSAKKLNWTDESYIVIQNTRLPDFPAMSGQGTSNLRFTSQMNTLYFEFLGLLHKPFDFSASFTSTSVDAHGLLSPGVGLGGSSDDVHAYGYNLLLNARYRWNKWAAGLEWLESSRQAFSFSTADEDLVRFYRFPGWGQHIYLTRHLTDFVTLRIGYRHKEQNYYPIGAGPIQSTDRELHNYYVRLRTDF